MNNMMSGMGTDMFFWIVLITLMCLLIIGACAWLLASWLKNHKAPMTQYTPQPRDAYEEYEQGYQPQQQPQKPIMKVVSVIHPHKMSRGKHSIKKWSSWNGRRALIGVN